MKKALLLLFVIPLTAIAQDNFQWDVRDSTEMSKDDIYAKAKQFIAETWNEPGKVIKNDDKESGLILLRGLHVEEMYYQMNNHRWTFSYQVKFQMRDNQWRMVIEDVHCESARAAQYDWPRLPMSMTYPEKGFKKTSLKEDRYLTIMRNVQGAMQSLADRYVKALNEKPVTDDW